MPHDLSTNGFYEREKKNKKMITFIPRDCRNEFVLLKNSMYFCKERCIHKMHILIILLQISALVYVRL